jgi:nucleoside-diphosphate-sugar epimerase
VTALLGRLRGRLVILGGAGKIGPSLVNMACRARQAAGSDLEIVVVDRFCDDSAREAFGRAGAAAVAADLMDSAAVNSLPKAEYVIYMVGQKFGTSENPALTWAINTIAPANVARHYASAKAIVTFSTGCVYELVPADSSGSREGDALAGPGEYANACIARERIFDYYSLQNRTPAVHVRLNYAVEMRYGVIVDLAQHVLAGRPVDLTMGYFNAIWQGDANAAVLALLEQAAVPPRPINLTGLEKLSVRQVATQLAAATGKKVRFAGTEAPTALLSDASRAAALLGPPPTPLERVIDWTADWMLRGQATLGKPTHFQTRDGKY